MRIRRSRAKGWRMPEGAIYVGRGSVWGNPFIVGAPSGVFTDDPPLTMIESLSLEQAVAFYRDMVTGCLSPEMHPHGHDWMRRFKARMHNGHPHEMLRSYLRGHDLCCWCQLDRLCHGDILLELADA